ncbi:GRHL2 [Cordylochernes scorpioides]|uniref:GRHL2 n=1 Tax=Cordylochernes scorpioides TaxID=51811 RepID=A0ABY6LL00_9ARAC|nr:GRHL2 [Cordylochernes scorpioides]
MPGHRKRRQFKQTDAFTRVMVIGLKRAGWSIRQIAADTHLGASTVHRLWRRWLEQGNVVIYRNVGATRVTSARVDRRILRQAVAAPQATCTAILQHAQDTLDHSITTRTISRRLVANGFHSCRPLRRLPLTPPNRRQRLEWGRARSTWMTEWHRVVFSDESRFCLSSDSRRVRVWRRRGERSNPAAIVERPTVRQRGIMVWGAIAYDSRSPLLRIQGTMTAQRYVDDVLRPVTLPYLQGVPNALYQQDNARPHTARISQQALQDVQMLPWPPYSPELSPIEHVWDIIGRRLHALPQPRSEDELWQMVEREWRAIPQDAIRTLTLYLDVLLRASPSAGAERKTRDEERRAAKRKLTATNTGRKRIEDMYHLPCERSEFYSMSDLLKQPVLFTPGESLDKVTNPPDLLNLTISVCAEADGRDGAGVLRYWNPASRPGRLLLRCRLYLVKRSVTSSFHGPLQFREQEKVTGGQIWGIRGVIVVQKPIFVLPQIRAFLADCFAQIAHNLQCSGVRHALRRSHLLGLLRTFCTTDKRCFGPRVVNGIGKKREAESNGQKFQVDRPRPVRTPATVSNVKRLATTENPPSQRQLSRMCGTSLKTINNIIHKDLELDTRRKGKVHKLTPFHMKNRATNARKLYEEHLAGSRSEYTATLDEAWMYVTYCNGIRKICYIKRGNQVPDNWVHQCSETFLKGFMVVGVMTGRGVLPLIKVPSKVKVNSEFYIECVLKPVIEQLKDLYPGEMDKVFLHHDKASSHTSNKTQQFLQEMKDTLGLNFIRNSDIPVKSPDASPLDFYGFGMLKQRLFNRRPKTEAGLWKAAQEEWSNVSLSKVKEVFAAWKVRCREIAKKKGKHIEHMKKIHVRKIKF